MPPIDASVVIVPYIEPVIKGRRVAVLGDATLQIGEAILERGARLVHVYDPNVARVAEVLARRGASRTLMTAPLPDGDLAVRDGAFDAIVVPNLTLFDPVDAIVARARKLVSAHGCAVFLSPNPAANPDSVDPLLSYYELYDLVALQFPEVRMLGQAPFAGYVVADLAPESDPDVVVDTSLMGKPVREPLWFIALGTQQPKRLDPFTIIQVPQSFEATPEGSETVSRLRQQIICLEKSLAEAQTLAVQVVPLAQPANDRADALEATLRERDEELRRAESRAGDNHVRAGRLETKVRDLEEELRNQRDRAFRLSNDLEEEKKLRTKADLELRMVRSRADMPPVQDPAKIAEIERLRSALAQADSKLHSLETDLANIKSRAANAQRQLSAAEDALEDLTAAKKQSDVRLATLQRIVTEKDARIARLDAEIVDYQENAVDPAVEQELAATQKAFDELQTAFDELQTAFDELQTAFDTLTAAKAEEVSKLVREIDEARRSVEKSRLEAETLRASVVREREAAALAVKECQEKSEKLKEKSEKLKEKSDRAHEKSSELQADLEALREQVKVLQFDTLLTAEREKNDAIRERDEAVNLIQATQKEHAEDTAVLERTLKERGQEIRTLQGVVANHERLVRELIQCLDSGSLNAPVQSAEIDLLRRLESILAETVIREGELQQARWRIAELEGLVREPERVNNSTQVTELETALFAAQNELDAMRQALANAPQAPHSFT